MNVSIVIPLYLSDPLHLDFTRQTLASIQTKHTYQVLLIVNHCAPHLEIELSSLLTAHCSLLTNPKGNILASAWNLGMQKAFGLSATSHKLQATSKQNQPVACSLSPVADYCLILNNDLILHPKAIDNLVQFAAEHPEFLLWTMTEWADMRTLTKATWDGSFSHHPHFSAFMLNKRTLDLVGWFDENFKPAYFEDNDYHIRILLKGKHAAATTTSKFYHFGSRTLHVDDSLRPEIKAGYQNSRKYMKQKWGADIHGHSFSPPEKILDFITKRPQNNKP